MDHGPILVDNNVLIGQGVKSWSEGDVFAHNLLVDCNFDMASDTSRQSQYYRPHTRIVVARKPGVPADDKWFYNIFIRWAWKGSRRRRVTRRITMSSWKGPRRVLSAMSTAWSILSRLRSVEKRVPWAFALPSGIIKPHWAKGPWVDRSLVGVFPTVGQTVEDYLGRPIRVDTDIFGKQCASPTAGPLADLKPGENTVKWSTRMR